MFCKIIIQLPSRGIFLGLWLRDPRCTLQNDNSILLVQQWMAASNHLINKCDQKIRQVKNQKIIKT